MTRGSLAGLALAGLVLGASPIYAQGLPGGASSLSESHGDWQVACEVVEQKPRCAFLQTQVSSQNGQRIISLELQRAQSNNSVIGAFILPFGLALREGVSAQVGTGAVLKSEFSTCLPAGCLAEVSFDAGFVDGLKAGDTLAVTARANGSNEEVKFSVSLKGFSAALARVNELQAL